MSILDTPLASPWAPAVARISRLVVPGLPHHVTQRGVRSLAVFDDDGDRELYLRLVREQCDRFGVRFLAWCLMSKHVHLTAVPDEERSLALGIGEVSPRWGTRPEGRTGATRGRRTPSST